MRMLDWVGHRVRQMAHEARIERGDGKGLIQAAGTGRVRDPRKRPTQVGTTWFHPYNVALASSGAAPRLRAGERITELGAAPQMV